MTQTLNCQDCNNSFEFTDSEQSFYEQKGFQIPKRCKDCRAKKKASRGDQRESYRR